MKTFFTEGTERRVKGGQSDDKTNHKNGSLGLFSTFSIIG